MNTTSGRNALRPATPRPVVALPHDDEVVLGGKHFGQRLPQQAVVVDEQHANLLGGAVGGAVGGAAGFGHAVPPP
jgi:hypothetical protein